MTLKEWCDAADIKPTHPTTEKGAVSLIATERSVNFTGLWRLSDYHVYTRSGVVIWLVPKQNGTDQAE